jgi:hypothetical protein
MSEESPLSPVRQRPKPVGQVPSIRSKGDHSSDSSPVFRRKNGNSGGAAAVVVDSADQNSSDDVNDFGAAAAVVDSADVSSQPKPHQGSKRDRIMRSRFMDLQAKEVKNGVSVSGSENSSDDGDESDLSCVSQTCDHSDADRHVYLRSLSSQGGFPTPMHKRRQKDSGMIPVAGMNTFFTKFDAILIFFMNILNNSNIFV